MSDDTVRHPHIANKLFLMETSEFGLRVESCQNQSRFQSNLNETCQISSDQDEQMSQTAFSNSKPFGCDNQSNLMRGRQTGSKPVLSNSLTYHSQTWYIDS